MNRDYAKKVIVSSLALSLLLGGGAYGSKLYAIAETPDAAAQSTADGLTAVKQERTKAGEKPAAERKEGKFERGMPIYEEAAAILGMDKEALKTELLDKSLVEVAADKGMSEADLVAKLLAERSKRIDEAVAAGKITTDKAAKMKEKMSEHLTFMVHQKGKDKFGFHGHHRKHDESFFGAMPAHDKLAAILGLTEEELKAQLKAGKSLTEIAESRGISKEQLIAKIKEEITPWIEKSIDRKHGAKAKSDAESAEQQAKKKSEKNPEKKSGKASDKTTDKQQ